MKPRLRLFLVLLAIGIAVSVAMSLGFWQLRRADQKIALQASIDAQSTKAALDNAALAGAAEPQTLVHQPVRLRGAWVPTATVFLDNRQMDAKVGFFVLTPLALEGGGVVLVQRGWAPRNFERRTDLPSVFTPAGAVEIEGRIAPPPSKLFEPGGASRGTIRQNLDLAQFRTETGLPLLPVMVVQKGAASDGLLRAWPAINLGVDKHYGYAFQWFALAFALTALTLWYQIIRPIYIRSKEPLTHV